MQCIDFICFILSLYKKILFYLSIIFTIWIDPLKYSDRKIITSKNNKFSIRTPYNKTTRMVSWFYRNYEIPDYNDWIEFVMLFNLQDIPVHTIIYYNDKSSFYITIRIEKKYMNLNIHFRNNSIIKDVSYSSINGLLPDTIIKTALQLTSHL
jgi:hypothetical protein